MNKYYEDILKELKQKTLELEEEKIKRKKAEEELEDIKRIVTYQQEFLYKVIDINPSHIFVRDYNGKIILANQKAASFYGIRPQELVGKTEIEINPNKEEAYKFIIEDKEIIDRNDTKIIPEEMVTDLKGNIIWLKTVKVPIISEKAKTSQVLVVSTDITNYKKVEKELKKERDRAQKYLDVAETIMVVINENEQVIHINKKACEILECNESEVIGRNWFNNFIPKDIQEEVRNGFYEFMSGEIDILEFAEYRILTKSGTEKVIEWHNGHLKDEDNKIVGTVISGQDITQRKEVDRMKSDLINTVSHEIRTPLASILGFVELLLKRELDQEKTRKYLQVMHKEARRLTDLINDFLDIQRMETGKQIFEKERFKIDNLINEVVEIYSMDKADSFKIEVHGDNLSVYGDYNRIKQLVSNLISNAKKYSTDKEEINIEIIEKEKELEIAVEDKGLGIPKESIPKLFSKFYRVDNSDHRKIGGTGLGLAICKEIVEAHGGKIWIKSRLGIGTKVYFTIPKLEYINEEKNDESKDYILIVEDDISLGQLISENISNMGLRCKIVESGEKALNLIEKNPPLVLILDIRLDGNLDGWQVLEKLKEKGIIKKVPIIISSALEKPLKEDDNDIYDEYLVKPYSLDQLNKTVVDLIEFSSQIKSREEVEVVIQTEKGNTDTIFKKLCENGFEVK
jgi:two-component system, OmpR family, sensor histidine kinase VicK